MLFSCALHAQRLQNANSGTIVVIRMWQSLYEVNSRHGTVTSCLLQPLVEKLLHSSTTSVSYSHSAVHRTHNMSYIL
eukprot:21084-Heterococcus_DN1.PRE.4